MAQATAKAILAFEPNPPMSGIDWHIEDGIDVPEPAEEQVLVRMVASGVCHTDILLGNVPNGVYGVQYPKILGHEGGGVVEKVGPGVTSVAVGDLVLMSFNHCRQCAECTTAHPAFCYSFGPLNYGGSMNAAGQHKPSGKPIQSAFFGQSSFASRSIVSVRSVVSATSLLQSEDELKLFAPLGCGLQTGAGSIINVAKPLPEHPVLVMGLGAVGMGALMAAKLYGCQTIIALDRTASRLELAKELGATHTIDSTMEGFDLAAEVRKISPIAAKVVIETTGAPSIVEAGLKAMGMRSTFVQLGVAPFDFETKVHPTNMINAGHTITGILAGDATPSDFVPKMIQWYREGKFPLDKIIKEYPLEDYKKAIADMHSGATIKPVLLF